MEQHNTAPKGANPVGVDPTTRMARWKLLALALICATPMIASYLTYYVIKPEGRTNYGTLLDPRQYPIPVLHGQLLDGKPAELDAWHGKWLMLQIDSGACAKPCVNKLFAMRQLQAMQGKNRERVERVWLITDEVPVDPVLLRAYDGMRMVRVKPEVLQNWLPTEPGTPLHEHMYLIDPLGNLMLRWPKDADPNKVKRDLGKVLYASGIG